MASRRRVLVFGSRQAGETPALPRGSWADHEHHQRVIQWQKGKSIAVCLITELGFLRISTEPVFGATQSDEGGRVAWLGARSLAMTEIRLVALKSHESG
jgi:hypothetical protein